MESSTAARERCAARGAPRSRVRTMHALPRLAHLLHAATFSRVAAPPAAAAPPVEHDVVPLMLRTSMRLMLSACRAQCPSRRRRSSSATSSSRRSSRACTHARRAALLFLKNTCIQQASYKNYNLPAVQSIILRVLASLSFSQSRPHRDFSRVAVRGDFGGTRLTPDF